MNMNPLENKFRNIWSLLFSPNECIVLLIFLSVLEQTGTCEPGVWLFLVLLCCSLTVVTKMQMKIRKCSLLNISVGSVKLLSLSSVIIRFINCARFTVKLMNLMLFQLLPPKKSKNEKAITEQPPIHYSRDLHRFCSQRRWMEKGSVLSVSREEPNTSPVTWWNLSLIYSRLVELLGDPWARIRAWRKPQF